MTQSGPYSSQPWAAGGGEEAYREPADPWSEPHYPDPDYPDPDYADPDYAEPTQVNYAEPSYAEPTQASYTEPSYAEPTQVGYGETGQTGYREPAPHPGYPGEDRTVQLGGTYPAGRGAAPRGAAEEFIREAPVGSPRRVVLPTAPSGRRSRNLPIKLMAVLVGLLVCAGFGTAAWLLTHSADAPTADPATTPTTAPPANTNPEPAPPPSSRDARFVTKGQCVRNDGTADSPEMTVSVCASGAYQVLARFDGRTTGEADAEAKCSKVPNYSKWYFYDSELDSLDFVLCLKER